jgi:glycosyltransferase involved in cell wall biosynthesis
MATKKVLFISYNGLTDPLGQSQVIPYLAGLTKHGYEFTILTCDKPKRYITEEQYVRNLIKPYPIRWVSIPYHKRPPVLSSLYDFFNLKRTAKKLHQENGFDMVHTRQGLPTLVALYLKKKYKIKFLDDVRGFWPDERVDGGIWNLKNPLFKAVYKFFKKHDTECLQLADHVVCLTYAAKKEMHSWAYIPKQPIPIEVIPCCVDLDLFDPAKIDTALQLNFKQSLGITSEDFIVSYLGSIGGWYLTDEMMRFCKRLSEKRTNAKFLFISPNGHEAIVAAAQKHGLAADKLIVKYAKRHEVPVLLSFSSYSIFFIKPCYSKISSSPTKHGEIMAMGIPIITNSGVGDVKEIVEKYDSGYVVDDFSDSSLDRVIDSIAGGKQFNKELIRWGAFDFYALETAVARYSKVYAGIFNNP